MTPEWDCFLRARTGDESAWQALLEVHQPRLSALALFITGSAQVVDDIVQETFVRALRARLADCRGTVAGFLGTIAYRLSVKERDRQRRHVKLEAERLLDPAPDPLLQLLQRERDRWVATAISALTEEQRQVLVLRYYGELSHDKIADMLQVPLGTVKSRMFHAIKSCRELLRKKGAFE